MTQKTGMERWIKAMDATWAPANIVARPPWTFRQGAGGGKRVSAATTNQTVTAADVENAEETMTAMDQKPLFLLSDVNGALDDLLADRGYHVVDPVLVLTAPCSEIAKVNPEPLKAIPGDEPLAIMREIWARGGIGAARIDVMRRTKGPKTYLFSRHQIDKPGGCAFVAVDGDIAMVHALEVVPDARRSGVGQNLLGRAAIWGMEQGAKTLALVTTGENLPAQKLFTGLGMQVVDNYHYRTQ